MVTATDASALNGASVAQQSGLTTTGPCTGAVQTAVTTLLTDNQPSATLDACTVFPKNTKNGYITVDARKPVSAIFSGVLGIGSSSAFSSTSVEYGFPTGASNLRPMGICILNDHVQEWLALQNGTMTPSQYAALKGTTDHPATYPTSGVVHRIYFDKQNAQSCGADAASGNWGWQDFNNGGNSSSDLKNWIQNGYSGIVGIHKPVPVCAASTYDPANGCIPGTTGSKGTSGDTQLQYLVDNHVHFSVPLFDSVVYGTGGNATFTIRAFLGVILWGFQDSGQETSRYLDVEFTSIQLEGNCCDSSQQDTGAFATFICSTDHDPAGAAARCTPS